MYSKLARLRLAALMAIACTSSTALADGLWQYRTLLVSWDATQENTDGSPITDLQGYYIYAGDSPEALIPMYYTDAPNQAFLVGYWSAGTRYFAVSAVNVDGVESALTGTIAAPAQ
jgi:hypothetical protein